MRGGLGVPQKKTTGAVETGAALGISGDYAPAKVRKLRFPPRSALKRRLSEDEGEDGEKRGENESHKKGGARAVKARKKRHGANPLGSVLVPRRAPRDMSGKG